MIDAFRKDFLRSEADWQTERKKFGRNRFGSETLSFFFFFLKALEAGTRGEEVIKNLSRIWRPFFFIGVLHFPRCTTIFPPPPFPPIFPHSFSLFLTHLPFYPSAHLFLFSLVETRIRPLWIPRRPSYLFPPTFSLSRKTRVHESSRTSRIRREIENVDNNGEIDRAVSYYSIIRKRIFSDLDDMTWPTLYYSR